MSSISGNESTEELFEASRVHDDDDDDSKGRAIMGSAADEGHSDEDHTNDEDRQSYDHHTSNGGAAPTPSTREVFASPRARIAPSPTTSINATTATDTIAGGSSSGRWVHGRAGSASQPGTPVIKGSPYVASPVTPLLTHPATVHGYAGATPSRALVMPSSPLPTSSVMVPMGPADAAPAAPPAAATLDGEDTNSNNQQHGWIDDDDDELAYVPEMDTTIELVEVVGREAEVEREGAGGVVAASTIQHGPQPPSSAPPAAPSVRHVSHHLQHHLVAVPRLAVFAEEALAPPAVRGGAIETIADERAGRVQRRYVDGLVHTTYQHGTSKEEVPGGIVTIRYHNGDIKRTQPSPHAPGGVIESYFFADATTLHTRYPPRDASSAPYDVYEFPTRQIELHGGDGSKEILFSDGSVKLVDPRGTERLLLPQA